MRYGLNHGNNLVTVEHFKGEEDDSSTSTFDFHIIHTGTGGISSDVCSDSRLYSGPTKWT